MHVAVLIVCRPGVSMSGSSRHNPLWLSADHKCRTSWPEVGLIAVPVRTTPAPGVFTPEAKGVTVCAPPRLAAASNEQPPNHIFIPVISSLSGNVLKNVLLMIAATGESVAWNRFEFPHPQSSGRFC